MSSFEDEIQNRRERRNWRHGNGNIITGVFIIFAGIILLLHNLNANLPSWLLGWEPWVFILGVYLGLKHNFRGFVWLGMILLATISTIDNLMPEQNLRQYAWPVVIIACGIFYVLKPKKPKSWSFDAKKYEDLATSFVKEQPADYLQADTIDATAVFGSVKKIVLSKNFRGGESVAVMGGVDIDFTQADINGRVYFDATNIMGGTKLIVPSSWDVQSEVVAIFGGVEDKRRLQSSVVDANKILVLQGTCMFGGIEIKNY